MDKLKTIIEQYSRWQPLSEYIERIEGFQHKDFSICLENAKSLLESIAKEICNQRNQPLDNDESISKLLGLSFGCLGYHSTDTTRQIGQAIANIGQQMGNFRNEIGKISHGRTMDELRNREDVVNTLTGDFLLLSTEIVSCFLIEAFETDNPLVTKELEIDFDENSEFNNYWDDLYGSFRMTDDLTYSASEVLYYVDREAYKLALSEYESGDK